MRASQRIIMGIDPGTNLLGFGVILVDANSVHLVDMGVVDLRKVKDHFTKLEHILRETGELMDKYAPDDIAIEAPFYGKNPQVMLKLGRAQGAAISAALSRQIPVYEYAPRKIKMAITGKGAASKEQVKAMVERTMDVKLDIKHLDASDAVAIAMCHFYQLTNPLRDEGAATNWKQFVEMHSERVKKS
ncbi:MAG: crossover junction endodeoxyribonuclease RuvC [Bacteroidales bacterium]|nr:crossover junction endodeoxyribonuclease RuvC [Bacteroidales bacterium]MBP5316806.1 crossover junction endodeoxyribonuclease RuvC [Bacteroidales bacterium]